MPFCPSCRDEFEEGIEVCADCRLPLVSSLPEVASEYRPEDGTREADPRETAAAGSDGEGELPVDFAQFGAAAIGTRFHVLRVIERGIAIWIRAFLPFSILALVVYVPFVVFTLLVRSYQDVALTLLSYVLDYALGCVTTAFVVCGVLLKLRGRPVSVSRSIATGIDSVPRVLGIVLVFAIPLAIFWGGFMLLLYVVDPGKSETAFQMVFVTTVVVCCLHVFLWVTIPVAVVERRGVRESVSRSWALSKGHRIAIIVLSIEMLGLKWIFIVLAGMYFVGLFQSLGIWPYYVVKILMHAAVAVVAATGYHALRMSKEGFTAGELSAIFD